MKHFKLVVLLASAMQLTGALLGSMEAAVWFAVSYAFGAIVIGNIFWPIAFIKEIFEDDSPW